MLNKMKILLYFTALIAFTSASRNSLIQFTRDDPKNGKEFNLDISEHLPANLDWRVKGVVLPVQDQVCNLHYFKTLS